MNDFFFLYKDSEQGGYLADFTSEEADLRLSRPEGPDQQERSVINRNPLAISSGRAGLRAWPSGCT